MAVSIPVWNEPPLLPELTGNDIHVWRAHFPSRVTIPRQALALLSPDELQRAERYIDKRTGTQFSFCRIWLRMLLGRYLRQAPASIRFRYNPHGKPRLDEPEGVYFNLAHSGDLALFAFSVAGGIGVDLENKRRSIDRAQSSALVFSEPERAYLEAVPVEERQDAFFRLWVRKEAFIKALGLGFSTPLLQYDVSRAPGEPVRWLPGKTDPEQNTGIQVIDFQPHPDYAAAVALQAAPRQIAFFEAPNAFDS